MTQREQKALLKYLAQVEKRLESLYGSAYRKVLQLQEIQKAIKEGNDEFTFDEATRKKLDGIMKGLAKQASEVLCEAVVYGYERAIGNVHIPIVEQLGEASKTILDDAVATRRANGVIGSEAYFAQRGGKDVFSKAVWNTFEHADLEIECMVQNGIKQGHSAAEISRDVRPMLKEPHKLFRRVRNKETGELELSKAAKAYHPGAGVYRSSYKNAMRLARTEVNMAYHSAENDYYQGTDLVKCYEIRLSNNHTVVKNGKRVPLKDICDDLVGIYPKWFKWTAWHPQCRCTMIPIPLDREEFKAFIRAKADGKLDEWRRKQPKVELPPQFREWMERNADRIAKAEARGKLPYFLRDNQEWVCQEMHQSEYVEWAVGAGKEAISNADNIKNSPLTFRKKNDNQGVFVVTKRDIRSIVHHNSGDLVFDALKNVQAKDIQQLIESSQYIGWSNVDDGKHKEVSSFVYYRAVAHGYDPVLNRSVDREMVICVRKMKHMGQLKPYAIIDQDQYDKRSRSIIQ